MFNDAYHWWQIGITFLRPLDPNIVLLHICQILRPVNNTPPWSIMSTWSEHVVGPHTQNCVFNADAWLTFQYANYLAIETANDINTNLFFYTTPSTLIISIINKVVNSALVTTTRFWIIMFLRNRLNLLFLVDLFLAQILRKVFIIPWVAYHNSW